MSQPEIDAIARATLAAMKPDLEEMFARARVAAAAVDASAASSGGGLAAPAALEAATNGTSVEDVETAVKGCFHAFEERIVKLEKMGDTVIGVLTKYFDTSLKKFLHERPVTQMTDSELIKALKKAFPTPTIRKKHADVLNNMMLSFIEDMPNDQGNTVTVSFPPASILLQTFPNVNFKRLCLCVAERLLQTSSRRPLQQQPHVVRGKSGVDPEAMDRVDHATDTIIRGTFHDPRCWARKIFYILFAYFLIKESTAMELTDPEAAKPSAHDGADADYFAVTSTLTATCSGYIAVGDLPAPEHKTDAEPGSALAGEHTITRTDNLHNIALRILQAVVRTAYKFDNRAVFSFAMKLRGLLVSPDRAWLTKPHREAEEGVAPGEWTLLMPRTDGRKELDLTAQRLTAAEKDVILTKYRADNSPNPSGDATFGGGSSSGGIQAPSGGSGSQTRPSTAQWLRNMSR